MGEEKVWHLYTAEGSWVRRGWGELKDMRIPSIRLNFINRESLPGLGLILSIVIYAGTVACDLSDPSTRISAGPVVESPSSQDFAPQGILSKEMDSHTIARVETPVEAPLAIAMRPMSRKKIEVVQKPAKPPPPPAEPAAPPEPTFPSMKLSGVFIGQKIQKAVAVLDGSKQSVAVGEEVGGWKLVELARTSAVFESPSGQKETVWLFPNSQ